jgi:hypothetical protein
VCLPARRTLHTGTSPRAHGLRDGALVGMPAPTAGPGGDIGLAGQMGDQWPPFPVGEVPW